MRDYVKEKNLDPSLKVLKEKYTEIDFRGKLYKTDGQELKDALNEFYNNYYKGEDPK